MQKFFQRTARYPTYAAEGAYAGVYAIAEAVKKVGNPDDTEALVKALEGLKIKLPKDPDGFTSYIDPESHQIVEVQAIGVTVPNDKFPRLSACWANGRYTRQRTSCRPRTSVRSNP